MTEYNIGTGGWGYFEVPNKSSLEAYSEIFGFVEVNNTFYEYPDLAKVERWRRTVPKDFMFSVRCHQDLTHKIGLKPVDEAYDSFYRSYQYCRVLDAHYLVLETPPNYILTKEKAEDTSDFFSSLNLNELDIVWEYRATASSKVYRFMIKHKIIPSIDISTQPVQNQRDVIYTRIFGKGKHNLYQFTDEELEDIDHKILNSHAKTAVISFHGARMYRDAANFQNYKLTGQFLHSTSQTGYESALAVLSEDAKFPSNKKELIEKQGWKVIDLTKNKRVHLSYLLEQIPNRKYSNLDDVKESLEKIPIE